IERDVRTEGHRCGPTLAAQRNPVTARKLVAPDITIVAGKVCRIEATHGIKAADRELVRTVKNVRRVLRGERTREREVDAADNKTAADRRIEAALHELGLRCVIRKAGRILGGTEPWQPELSRGSDGDKGTGERRVVRRAQLAHRCPAAAHLDQRARQVTVRGAQRELRMRIEAAAIVAPEQAAGAEED